MHSIEGREPTFDERELVLGERPRFAAILPIL